MKLSLTPKIQSKIASHWLYHLTVRENVELHPEFYIKLIYSPKTHELTGKIYKDTITIQLPKTIKFKYYFKNKHCITGFNLDGFNVKSMTAYEFYGDYWHGNPNTIHQTPKIAELRYQMTLERESILKLLGIKIISMWEDDWKYEMNNFTEEYRNDIIEHVNNNFIDPREALHGGRTEVFKTFYETKAPGEIIFGYDISSQYPSVMALDSYATGVKQCKNTRLKN